MDKNTKIILGIIGGIILLCLFCSIAGYVGMNVGGKYLLEQMIIEDPAEVASLADQIADYNLPPGYQEQALVDFFVGKILMIGKGNNDQALSGPLIMLFELPADIEMDQDEIRLRIELEMKQRLRADGWDLILTEEKPAIIRNQEVTLLTYEGTDDTGQSLKQIFTTFNGKNGTIMLMIMGRANEWNSSEIDEFIKSIR